MSGEASRTDGSGVVIGDVFEQASPPPGYRVGYRVVVVEHIKEGWVSVQHHPGGRSTSPIQVKSLLNSKLHHRVSEPGSARRPWATWPWNRCSARTERKPGGTYGRCDLRRGHEGDHALERGMDTPQWSTRWTR